MTEQMIVEAVRAAGAGGAADPMSTGAAQAVADPSAVARFEAAMAAGAPQQVAAAGPRRRFPPPIRYRSRRRRRPCGAARRSTTRESCTASGR